MSDEERNELLARAEENLRALELFSGYLNLCPRYVKAQDVREMTAACGVDEETAVRLLVAAACGLDGDTREADRAMEERYFRPAIHRLDAALCRDDPYYQTIRLPEISRGEWRMGYKTLDAYEAFTADDLLLLPDGREVPQIGFFSEPFRAPMVEQNGREWMTVTPSEINTMTGDIRAAHGRVAVFGLGLGYYAFMAAQKPEVSRVVVIEREESVISLFRECILPQFPHAGKITVERADAFAYAQAMAREHFDVAYVDLWHDVLDGVPMYLRMKRLERGCPQTVFRYWIEPSMLAWLRGMALMELSEKSPGPMLQTIGVGDTASDMRRRLSNENLRRLADRIPSDVAER